MALLTFGLWQNHETDPDTARCLTNLDLAGAVARVMQSHPDLDGLSHASNGPIGEFELPLIAIQVWIGYL
jgi:hypothetical protein